MVRNSDWSTSLACSFFIFVIIILGCLFYVFYELIEVLLNNEVWYGASFGDVIFTNSYLGGDPLKFQILRVTLFSVCLVASYLLSDIVFRHLHKESPKHNSALKKVAPLISAFSAILVWQIARIFQSSYVPLGLINYVALGLAAGLSPAFIRYILKHSH